MKLIPVDQIPKMNGYHKLQDLIEEFVNGDATPMYFSNVWHYRRLAHRLDILMKGEGDPKLQA